MTNGSQEEFMLNKSSSQLQIFLTKLNKVINVIKTTVSGSPSFSVRVSGCFCTDMTPVLFFEQRRNLLGFSQAWMMGRCDGLAGWCRSQTTRAWISPEQVSHSSVCTWRCRMLPRVRTAELPQTVCCTSLSFSVGVGDIDTICYHSVCVILYHRCYKNITVMVYTQRPFY